MDGVGVEVQPLGGEVYGREQSERRWEELQVPSEAYPGFET